MFALWCQLGLRLYGEGRGCCVDLQVCYRCENDNEDLMALSASREICNCAITARGGYSPKTKQRIGELTLIASKSNS